MLVWHSCQICYPLEIKLLLLLLIFATILFRNIERPHVNRRDFYFNLILLGTLLPEISLCITSE